MSKEAYNCSVNGLLLVDSFSDALSFHFYIKVSEGQKYNKQIGP